LQKYFFREKVTTNYFSDAENFRRSFLNASAPSAGGGELLFRSEAGTVRRHVPAMHSKRKGPEYCQKPNKRREDTIYQMYGMNFRASFSPPESSVFFLFS